MSSLMDAKTAFSSFLPYLNPIRHALIVPPGDKINRR
jgi:hypothetical protein